MRTAFEREGDIRSVDLLAAFATLWRQRSSGVLRFSGSGESIRFEVLEGDVVRVFASDPGFDAIEVLLRAGKLDATTLEGRRLPSGKDRALAAREKGLLTERDWRWGERIRVVEILAHLVAWLDGSYAFDSSARPEAGELTVGVHRLILELFLRSRDRAFVHHALPAVDAPLQRAADFDEKFATLGLTPDALAVAAAIDGRSTAAEISRRTPPDPFAVEKLLAALATLGLLHPEYAAEPPRAAPGRDPGAVPEAAPETELPRPSLATPPTPAPEAKPSPASLAAPPAPAPESVENDLAEEAEEPEIDLPLGAPVEPSEPAAVGWENAPPEPMDQPLDVAGAEIAPPTRRSIPAAVWVLLVLAIAVGALLFSRARETGTALPPPSATALPAPPTEIAALAPPGDALPTALPSAVPTLLPTPVPSALPTVVPTPVPTPVPAPRPTAVPTPVPTARPPAPPTAVVPAAVPPTRVPPTAPPRHATPGPAGAGRTRAEWLAVAERDRLLLQQQPKALFTIQLELVCELPSLTEAWRFDRRGEMWLAPAEHRGRPCFRVFWGRYADLDSARRAKGSVPRYFFTPTNHPAVVSTRALLP